MENMEVNIRNLESKDFDKATEIFCNSFKTVGENWNIETATKRLEQYYDPESCWVAEVNSKIIGFLTSELDYVIDHKELYIDVIAVEPEYHKSGIGNRLLKTAENYAKSKGYKALWLTASKKLPSFNWYIKEGFEETSWRALNKDLS
jgi:ribosomal protein S18 acetylase RimI-like enzyme